VAVQDAEAPRRQDEQRHAREEHAHQHDGERAPLAVEAGREEIDQQRRRRDAESDERGHRQRERGAHRARDAPRAGDVALGEEPRIHRDERRREHALAEQVLQQVGNAERGLQRVGDGGVSEVVRQRALAHEAGDAAREDARRDQRREATGARRARRRVERRVGGGLGAHRGLGSRQSRPSKLSTTTTSPSRPRTYGYVSGTLP
jgi:hypothetical protein